MQVGQELLALGGVARRADLVRVTGLAPRVVARELAVLVGSGEVTNPRRGIYAVRGAPRDAVTAVAASGVLTCVSIAAMWRLPLLTAPVAAHVAIPASASGSVRSRVPGGTVLHRDLGIAPGQRFDGPEPALALAHAVQCLPLPEAVAVLDAAVGRGLVRREDLAARRPRKGWLAHERATRLIDPGSGSIGESIARVALVGAGLTVQTQARIPGVGRVDMLVEGLVVVEVDGFAYHSGRARAARPCGAALRVRGRRLRHRASGRDRPRSARRGTRPPADCATKPAHPVTEDRATRSRRAARSRRPRSS